MNPLVYCRTSDDTINFARTRPATILYLLALVLSNPAFAHAQPVSSEGAAFLYGIYMAKAAACDLPSAQIEKGFETYLTYKGIGPKEAERLRGVMMQSRVAYRSLAKPEGCEEVKTWIKERAIW